MRTMLAAFATAAAIAVVAPLVLGELGFTSAERQTATSVRLD